MLLAVENVERQQEVAQGGFDVLGHVEIETVWIGLLLMRTSGGCDFQDELEGGTVDRTSCH
jgi:hypothetical protein